LSEALSGAPILRVSPPESSARISSCLLRDFLFAINTIPDEGTLLREESSPQVWIIQDRTRVLAPLHPSGTVHVLWDGALAQIPLPKSILAGVVTDMNGSPLSDATVLIGSWAVR
jgi:hypothetical protein